MAATTPEVSDNILARSHPSHAVPSSAMTSRARIEESEPISPELVLVSSPELAQAVREQLSTQAPAVAKPAPGEHGELTQAVGEQLPTPAPAVAKSEPDELDQEEGAEDATLATTLDEPDIEALERGQARHAELGQARRDQLSTEAPAVAKSEPDELDRKDGAEDVTLAPTLDELDIKTLERLQARHAELAQAVREQLSRPAPAVAKPDPDEHSARRMTSRPGRLARCRHRILGRTSWSRHPSRSPVAGGVARSPSSWSSPPSPFWGESPRSRGIISSLPRKARRLRRCRVRRLR